MGKKRKPGLHVVDILQDTFSANAAERNIDIPHLTMLMRAEPGRTFRKSINTDAIIIQPVFPAIG